MAIDHLTLISGVDIPLHSAQVVVHQPTIKEISYIGEEVFFQACQIFISPKDIFKQEGKNELEHISNFQIIVMLLESVFGAQEETSPQLQELALTILLLLSLLFPDRKLGIEDSGISLTGVENIGLLSEESYEELCEIIREIFGLAQAKASSEEYNPAGDKAKEIAEKFKKAKEKRAEMAASSQPPDKNKYILKKYVSILSVGLQLDMTVLLNYTIYQLLDNFHRLMKQESYKINLQARMAGATGLDEAENWMED